jgi:asparagine N-glycosylation enzyme membrane subunit Stt3
MLVLLAAIVATIARPGFTVTDVLGNWDSIWYRIIMADGYPSVIPEVAGHADKNQIAFFPLYPITARWVSAVLPVSDTVASLLTSLLFGAVGIVLIALLARALADEETGIRAATLFAFFPGSMALSMAYTEALFVVLAGVCLWAVLRRYWLLAGLAAGLATAARPHALVLAVACLWAAGVAIKERREWRALIAPLLAPAGLLAYFGYLWVHTGDATAWFRVERGGWSTQVGGGSGFDLIAHFLRQPFTHPQTTIGGLSFLFALASLVVLVRRHWPGFLTVYTLAIVVVSVTSRNDGLRPRDILTALPIFVALGNVSRGTTYALLAGGFAGTLVLAIVYHALPGAVPP